MRPVPLHPQHCSVDYTLDLQLQHLFSGTRHPITSSSYARRTNKLPQNGYLWIHPVAEHEFVIDAGKEKALHSYEFAMRGTTHLFCPECGSSIMARRRDALPDKSLRINARMLEDFDLSTLKVKSFSGAEVGPKYEPKHNSDVQ